VCVLPVMAEEIDFTTLPRWMRHAHFFDFKYPEQGERFIRTLQSLCQAPRVPFMVEDKPDDFVERPKEFNQLLALLLDPKREEPIAITAALRGAGGYGKTTLAKALCHDEAIQNAFDDGILWVTLCENPGDLTGRVEDLIYTLSGERPGFSSVQAAAARLAELLADRDILLVIDDVWNAAHLTPFLQGGSRCSRLITTRNSDTLPAKTKGIDLDAMRPDEATSLLGFNLPEGESSELKRLAQRLGEWPLLLKLVNATLRYRVHDLQQPFAAAIASVNALLDEYGLMAFDQDNARERHQAVAKTLEVSLRMLDEADRQRYFELAIFPEDVNIPLVTLEKLWSVAGYKPVHTEKLCEKLHKLSLLLHFDLSDRTIRLHDVMRQYLVQKIGADLPKLHAQFLDTYCSTTSIQTWANLPTDEPYLWRNLAYHLHGSGQAEILRRLLLDYNWLANKLAACEINALLADYDFFPQDQDLQLIQSALRLSSNVLSGDCNQLSGQLHGRLLGHESSQIQAFLEKVITKTKGLWLRPLFSSLTAAGGSLLRTLDWKGFGGPLTLVAITSDGKLAVSVSNFDDKILEVWNLQTDKLLRTLEGHDRMVTSVAITPDGKLAVSGSYGKTLKVWNLHTGACVKTLEGGGYGDPIHAVALASDGKIAVSAGGYHDAMPDEEPCDYTVKVWNLRTGKCLKTLEGHNDVVNAVALTSDSKIAVSASSDKTLKVWDLHMGACLKTLEGHSKEVTSVAITPNDKLVVSASDDKTLKILSLRTGECIKTLEGHGKSVNAVVLTPDNKIAVSASDDKTLKVWDLRTGNCLKTFEGHSDPVKAVALISDGKIAVSVSETTLKFWNLHKDACLKTERHSKSVNAVVLAPDGKIAVSASSDTTLKVWDLHAGACLKTLEGHNDPVKAVAFMLGGKIAASAAGFARQPIAHNFKVWNLHTGSCLENFGGHIQFVKAIALKPASMLKVSTSRDKIWNLYVLEFFYGRMLENVGRA
jgi:WD40 repeat protein